MMTHSKNSARILVPVFANLFMAISFKEVKNMTRIILQCDKTMDCGMFFVIQIDSAKHEVLPACCDLTTHLTENKPNEAWLSHPNMLPFWPFLIFSQVRVGCHQKMCLFFHLHMKVQQVFFSCVAERFSITKNQNRIHYSSHLEFNCSG